ncbi:MAG TPA: RNB domain-containing ribonuclease, partial [Candidatus Krumholzibacteria bacterium]|nr:RNB domain-containing ribonuclease [Candidatus Krumholzibacteria bacterium]
MTDSVAKHHRPILQKIARRVMIERGLAAEVPADALAELAAIKGPATQADEPARDLRALPWCSIDNDDSLDLDQLSVAEALPDGTVRILVAVADVDALVRKDSAIDDHARQNTTSVYTAAEIFPMLPEKLSTNLTSLNPDADRLAVVVDMVFAPDGVLKREAIYGATVRNRAKLAYDSVAAWLEETGPMPGPIAAVPGLEENLRLQDRTAQQMKARRHQHGALSLQTIEARPVFTGDDITDLKDTEKNRAKDIIEDFMIAANGVTARYLESQQIPSLRRVVTVPKRWSRIVELAAQYKERLPAEPDSKALEAFLVSQREKDPLRFPDLSLTVVKLMGAGEYIVEIPGEDADGHFGLAVRDYTHSTAPNRRYPDVITQRLVKASLAGKPRPYEIDELETLARHCTDAEDAAQKVERQVGKSAAALLLQGRAGEQFDGIVTGTGDRGTWVRLLHPTVEGRLERGFRGLDVGDRVRVQLLRTNVERGYIDFVRVKGG